MIRKQEGMELECIRHLAMKIKVEATLTAETWKVTIREINDRMKK